MRRNKLFVTNKLYQGLSEALGFDFNRGRLSALAKPNATTILPTFTNATTSGNRTVVDWEGIVRPVLSGEIRYPGMRRVRNDVTADFTAWAGINGGTGTAATVTAGQTDPDGGSTSYRIQVNRVAGE